jgi:hypothetical protein
MHAEGFGDNPQASGTRILAKQKFEQQLWSSKDQFSLI